MANDRFDGAPNQPRKRWTTNPWPWPGDSREDKAKRVALSYRQLAFDIAQARTDDPAGALHQLDRKWAQLGVYWPVPSPDLVDPDERISAADAAHLTDRATRDIYDWARRGHIEQRTMADGSAEYRLGSIIDYARAQRLRRHQRRSSA